MNFIQKSLFSAEEICLTNKGFLYIACLAFNMFLETKVEFLSGLLSHSSQQKKFLSNRRILMCFTPWLKCHIHVCQSKAGVCEPGNCAFLEGGPFIKKVIIFNPIQTKEIGGQSLVFWKTFLPTNPVPEGLDYFLSFIYLKIVLSDLLSVSHLLAP